MSALALYTTMYPGGERFWSAFLESISSQSDQDFDIWIGIDELDPESVRHIVQEQTDVAIHLVPGGGTPAGIRCRALRQIVERYDGVVLVDSDDVLCPSRVAAARAGIEQAGLVGCALYLIDEQGQPLHRLFCPPSSSDTASLLPAANVFGFSNTAYRSDTLRLCLPLPENTELVDWHVATKAWLLGAPISFDSTPHMCYRQYVENAADVLGPFTPERIYSDIPRVLRHYDLLLRSHMNDTVAERHDALEYAYAGLAAYWNTIQEQPERLDAHARNLNFGRRVPMWWEWVTAPVLPQTK